MSRYHFTFLRHGESVGNRDNLVQGQHDFALSPSGRTQIEELAADWQADERQFDAVIASPLQRARQTARILQKAIPADLHTDPLWVERHRGQMQGVPRPDVQEIEPLPGTVSQFFRYGETGESDWQLSLRAGRALQSLFSHPPGRYLIVSHGGLLNKLLHLMFGFKDGHGFYFHLSNAGSCEVEYNLDDHRWYLRSMDARHGRKQPYNSPAEDLRFVMLRHAESEGNRMRLFQGQAETPLTENGRQQAEAAGKKLHQNGYRFQSITASPQQRARHTAQAVADQFGMPIQLDERLKEINNGRMAGLNGEQIDARFPTRTDRQNPYLPVGETGESWFELYLRAGEVVHSLVTHPHGEYLIVSHGAFLNSLLWSILGMVPQPSSRPGLFHFGNTGYADLIYHQSLDRWTLLTLNPGASREE